MRMAAACQFEGTREESRVPFRFGRAINSVCLTLAAAFALTGCITTSVAAQDAVVNPFATFQEKEARLFGVGYRLAVSNAPFCANLQPTIGLVLHDALAYSDPDAVRRVLGLSGDIGVQAVAIGSPAHMAGLRTNDTVLAIDDVPVMQIPVGEAKWERAANLRDLIVTSLTDGSVRISWVDNDNSIQLASIAAEKSCASIFELQTGHDDAKADGARVLVGDSFAGFDYREDEFAAILAHEMAHNLLDHLDTRKASGKRRSLVRQTEREADRLMPWLLVNAGYDPAAAVRMMERWGPRHGGGLLRKRTHDGWDERRDLIAAELPRIARIRRQQPDGKADWSIHFRYVIPDAASAD